MPLYMTLLEVMDKEPSLMSLWVTAAVLGAGGLFACHRWPWTTLVLLPVGLALAWAVYSELTDSHVGPSIRNEAGMGYVAQAYAAAALTVALPLVGLAIRKRRSRTG
jgi:hypothetical protein